MSSAHTDFDEVFLGGRFGDFDVTSRRVGELAVTSGGVAVLDPQGDGGRIDTPDLPVGTFPVEIAVASFGGHETIACLRVSFDRERAATWELQKPRRDRPRPPFEIGGVLVDSGWIAFADSATNIGYANDDEIVGVEVRTHDREYGIYVGRTSDGRVTSLAVDGDLLTVPLYEDVEIALPLTPGRLEDPRFDLVGVEAWATSPNQLELRGDIARICSGSARAIVETRPAFVQRFTFAGTGRAFVRLYVGRRALARS